MLMSMPSLFGLKEVQIGAHDFKLYNVPFFARKLVNINVSSSAAPKLDLVLANCYNCNVKQSTLMIVPSFIRIERGSDGYL